MRQRAPRRRVEEARLLVRIVAEDAAELGRHGGRALLAHAAHRHAGVLGLEHHRDSARLERLLDRFDDLGRQRLLRLQAAGEGVDDPRELRQADDAAAAGNSRYAPCRRTARCGVRNAKRRRYRAPVRGPDSPTRRGTRASAACAASSR